MSCVFKFPNFDTCKLHKIMIPEKNGFCVIFSLPSKIARKEKKTINPPQKKPIREKGEFSWLFIIQNLDDLS